ncbi:hypothetical protein P692DRAFT_20835071 [Suillus brevipes Sb2]|nr:hypothetical protein P692DRAFT_20835071 [Suillus brevipes Sb2]
MTSLIDVTSNQPVSVILDEHRMLPTSLTRAPGRSTRQSEKPDIKYKESPILPGLLPPSSKNGSRCVVSLIIIEYAISVVSCTSSRSLPQSWGRCMMMQKRS